MTRIKGTRIDHRDDPRTEAAVLADRVVAKKGEVMIPVLVQPGQELELSLEMEQRLRDVPLIPVDCTFGVVREKSHEEMNFTKVIQKERKRSSSGGKHQPSIDVTVVFAIRRPGCGACREHGQQLSYLLLKNTANDVNAIGIIKETNVDDPALLEFYNKYYKYPIYKDSKWQIYTKILGNRKLPIWSLLWNLPRMNQRYRDKNIVNIPFGGDISTLGGVLILDRDYRVRHIFYETYTKLYNLHDIQTAIEAARTSPL